MNLQINGAKHVWTKITFHKSQNGNEKAINFHDIVLEILHVWCGYVDMYEVSEANSESRNENTMYKFIVRFTVFQLIQSIQNKTELTIVNNHSD